MNDNEFISLVKKRARRDTEDQARRVTEATLTTLAERLAGNEADDLASQLPPTIGSYLRQETTRKTYNLDEFYAIVAQRASFDFPDVQRRARAVISVVSEIASPGEMDDVLSQLPNEYIPLFTFGGDGDYRELESRE